MEFFKNRLTRAISDIPGWKSNKKIIAFESDDWGSVRMPSLETFRRLEAYGLDLRSADAERYNLNDTLATSNDLEGLFEVLASVKDSKEASAVFTPVSIVANPDFQKIKESDFQTYYYEPFSETLKSYKGCDQSFNLWKQGIEEKIFVPQMHGREHLNVTEWLKALRSGEKHTRAAFDEGMWGFVPKNFPVIDYQAAFLFTDPKDMDYQKTVINEGLELFEDIFGYKASFFVPPNGVFNNSLNRILVKNDIEFRYASKIQNEPIGFGRRRKRFHYLGQKGTAGIRYIIRNCFFEPSLEGKDWVDSCLSEINSAFELKKPAIIGSHRVNYIGALNPFNRDKGLHLLSNLLNKIVRKWPEAEFMTTAELGGQMNL